MSDTPYGWHAVPRNPATILNNQPRLHEPKPYTPADHPIPTTALATRARDHVSKLLPTETLNHSHRVYVYGMSIMSAQFPHWLSSRWIDAETWYLTCLFHDIGTTSHNLRNTHMSFDFWGGIDALQTLKSWGAPQSQAESVAEAIIRHQDPGETGTITCMGLLVQMATEFDNMGHYEALVDRRTIESTVKEWPRRGWSGCFSKTIEEEMGLKPWAHSSAIEGFADMIKGNELMKPFE
ncbi:cyanamide hydratase [Saccharata proteae CBS 121410]|uniref:Cyanamide hydratase n=1 Tax=Saccharata proteae CBS 121410 TaxID=1314787 RepID=A0A9P4HU78_9PEZI|nr:cyanamide hydratase [Saccharata proteae CBS 121410]